MTDPDPQGAGTIGWRDKALAVALLLAVYLATLAPDLTLWDSGEFLSAIATLGVPHPPGTPLFVVIGRAWSETLGFLPVAVAVNLASAVATAVACAVLSAVLLGWAGRSAVVAGALIGGTLSAVWQNATETEVYAVALCLGALYLVAADAAGRRHSARHRLLVAFLFGLAVPLQIIALVAGPAAILLLSHDAAGRWSWRTGIGPGGAWCLAVGIGLVSPVLVAMGTVLLLAATVIAPDRGSRRVESIAGGALVLLGASALLVMLVRAQHDPWINQGNPSSWAAFWDVVGRRQYDVPGLWPRRAPWWLQLGNLIQYADWQIAAGLSDAVGPSWRRTPLTVAAMIAAVYGAAWHRRRDPRTFRAFVVLLLCASVGVVAMLNLRAGPSYGWGVLPEGALREARERDYFFALAFLLWGLWTALGVARLAAQARRPSTRIVVMASCAIPMLFNWRAVDRQRHPDAALAGALGESILLAAPAGAVVVTGGDNDTYAIWYRQAVLGERGDVTSVVSPLLGARWYREELRRRHGLLTAADVDTWRGESHLFRTLAAAARSRARPLVASAGLTRAQRLSLAAAWRTAGLVYLAVDSIDVATEPEIDARRSAALALTLTTRGLTPDTRPARTPSGRYVQQLLLCPQAVLDRATTGHRRLSALLESVCNS